MIKTVGELSRALSFFPASARIKVNSAPDCGIDEALKIESVQGIDARGDVVKLSRYATVVTIRAPEQQ